MEEFVPYTQTLEKHSDPREETPADLIKKS